MFCISPTLDCCGTPRGLDVIGSCLLSTTSLFLSNAATKWCDYVSRYVEGTIPVGEELGPLFVTRDIGLWGYSGYGDDEGKCYEYPEDFEYDDYFQFARAMSVLTSLIGGICTLSLLAAAFCVGFSNTTFVAIATGLFLTMVCELLTLLIFQSNLCTGSYEMADAGVVVQCEHAWGSQVGILAALVWSCACLSVCFIPPAQQSNYSLSDNGNSAILIHQSVESVDLDLEGPLLTTRGEI